MAIILGLDIGGANVKAATADGRAWQEPFALWKDPAGLAPVLRELLYRFPDVDTLAVTMTGELCDCFATKRDGVHAILDAVDTVRQDRDVRVWGTDSTWHTLEGAKKNHLTVAAANWHALATYVGTFAANALLVDTGSTTTDVIPIEHGLPTTIGRTDVERLTNFELVYTGALRTPLCALPVESIPIAAEFFATTQDVNIVLGLMPEDASDTDTADHRPATFENALARLARMRGGDRETLSDDDIITYAMAVHRQQVKLIVEAIRRLRERPGMADWSTVVISGSGEFLARKAVAKALPEFPEANILSLNDRLGDRLSTCAPAYALAWMCPSP